MTLNKKTLINSIVVAVFSVLVIISMTFALLPSGAWFTGSVDVGGNMGMATWTSSVADAVSTETTSQYYFTAWADNTLTGNKTTLESINPTGGTELFIDNPSVTATGTLPLYVRAKVNYFYSTDSGATYEAITSNLSTYFSTQLVFSTSGTIWRQGQNQDWYYLTNKESVASPQEAFKSTIAPNATISLFTETSGYVSLIVDADIATTYPTITNLKVVLTLETTYNSTLWTEYAI